VESVATDIVKKIQTLAG